MNFINLNHQRSDVRVQVKENSLTWNMYSKTWRSKRNRIYFEIKRIRVLEVRVTEIQLYNYLHSGKINEGAMLYAYM